MFESFYFVEVIRILIYILIGLMPILCSILLFDKDVCTKSVITISEKDIIYIKNEYHIYIFLVCAVLFFFSTIRAGNIGADYPTYIAQYLGGAVWYNKHEWAFAILIKIVYWIFGNNYWGLAFCVNIIIFGCLIKNISDFAKSKFVFYILLVFAMNPYMFIQNTFNIMRQGCMAAIMCLGVRLLIKDKYVHYILITLFAAGFHKSALVFLILIPFKMIRFDKFKHCSIAILCFALNVLVPDLSYLNRIVQLFGYEKLLISLNEPTMFNFKVYSLFILFVILFFIYFYDDLFVDKSEKFFVDLYILSLCFLLIAVKGDMFYRIYISMVFISLPAIEIILRNFSKVSFEYKIFIYVGYIIYYILFYVSFLISIMNNPAYIPYQTIF